MRTARSLIVSPYLIVSHACPPQGATTHAPRGATMETPPKQPRTSPRSNHACPPRATMHTPGSNHACPPRATTHAPLGATMHAPLGATMHAPLEQPCMPPEQPCMPPRATTHAPQEQPCPPGATMPAPPVNRMTNWCKNITLPQTSFASGNNSWLSVNTGPRSPGSSCNCGTFQNPLQLTEISPVS